MYMTRSRTRASRCIETLQRRWKRYHHRIDPITREPVRFPIFVHVHEGGDSVFSARTLAEYVRVSGDYRNPLTRQPFNRCEVLRLARIVGDPNLAEQEVREAERKRAAEQESLRTWFLGELENDIYMLRDFARRPTSTMPYSTSFVVRQMLAVTFPSLIVNIVRILRLGESYGEHLFVELRSTVRIMRTCMEEEEALTPQFTTALVVFDQFLNDLEHHVQDGTLLAGTTANVVIGGMNIRLNLRDI
ncbi:MAG: hypothetical protein CL450_08875 [Acidimicrobiaceae bacterium]|nr:hypothetical protein [Acidimicrobiaceae bacterium]